MMRALLLALLLACAGAQAQLSDERLAAARELVEAGQLPRQIELTLEAMRQNLLNGLRQSSPTLSDAERLRALDEFILPEVRNRSAEFVERAVAIWATHLTTEEMRAMQEFHRTPLGQRMLEAQPLITAQLNEFAQGWAVRVVSEALTRHREALRARGFNL